MQSFRRPGAVALRTMSADLNGDGQIGSDELVAAGAMDGEHYYLDQAGQRFSSARDGIDRRVVVESSGPVHACVRVDGFYTGPIGERIAKYRTRYHFFAGLPLVKVIDELGFIGSTKPTRFSDIGFAARSEIESRWSPYRRRCVGRSGQSATRCRLASRHTVGRQHSEDVPALRQSGT